MTTDDAGWIRPDWPVPPGVHALITTRGGGVSIGPWGVPPEKAAGLNLGFLSGDAEEAVRRNRAVLRSFLPSDPRWLKQVHGPMVVRADDVQPGTEADAAFTTTPGVVPAVMVADCMPVLLVEEDGKCVGVAHAGWRGLASGVIQATVRAMRQALGRPHARFIAYLGPAIGPDHFEVGPEVREAMAASLPHGTEAFRPQGSKYLADLFRLGRQALQEVGVTRVHGGGECTFCNPRRFYSFRRDGTTGRHAALIWFE